jgi:hypothetical protein
MKYSPILASAINLATGLLVAAAPASSTTSPSNTGNYKDHKPYDKSAPSFPISTPVPLPTERAGQRRHEAVEEIIGDPIERASCGKIFVQSTGPYSGYVQGTRDDQGRYVVGSDQVNALKVKFHDQTIILDHEFQNGFPRLGTTFGMVVDSAVGEDNMAGNSFNYAYISATGELHKAGEPAITDSSSFNAAHGTNQHVESAIFTLGDNEEILASWTNTNGQTVPVQFAISIYSQLVISANAGAYSARFGGERAPSARLFCRANDRP